MNVADVPDEKEFVRELKAFIGSVLHTTDSGDHVQNLQNDFEKLLRKHGHGQLKKFNTVVDFGTGASYSAASWIKYIARLHVLTPGAVGLLLDQLKPDVGQDGVETPAALLHSKFQIAQAVKYALQLQQKRQFGSVLVLDDQQSEMETLLELMRHISKDLTPKQGQNRLTSSAIAAAECSVYIQLILAQLIECVALKMSKFGAQEEGPMRKTVARLSKYVALLENEIKATLLAKLGKLGLPLGSGQVADAEESPNVPTPRLDLEEDTPTFSGTGSSQLCSNGYQLLVQTAEKSGPVRADAVRVQQTTTSVTKTSVSEKTQIESINLSKALSTNRESLRGSNLESTVSVLPAQFNNGKSVRSYFRTTGQEVDFLHNFASGKNTLCQDDINYLKNKLTGFMFNAWDDYITTETKIASTFVLVAQRQVLDPEIQNGLADAAFGRKLRAKHHEYRILMLKTLQLCAKRADKGRLPPHTAEVLTKFRDSGACTEDMKKILWQIFVEDDNNLVKNFEIALDYIERTRDPEAMAAARAREGEENPMTATELIQEIGSFGTRVIGGGLLLTVGLPPLGLIRSAVNSVMGSVAKGPDASPEMGDEGYDWPLIDSKLDYLRQQIVIEPRAKDLESKVPFFDRLLRMLTPIGYPLHVRAKAAQLVDDLFDHAHIPPMDPEQLEAYVDLYEHERQTNDGEDSRMLKQSLIKSVLKSMNKRGAVKGDPPEYSSALLNLLVQVATAEQDPKLEALVTVSLGNLVVQNPEAAGRIPDPTRLAYKLEKADYVDEYGNVFLEEVVKSTTDEKKQGKVKDKDESQVLEEDFETNNSSMEGCTYVSALTANILLESIFKRLQHSTESSMTTALLDHVLLGLTKAADKQTRILCSECLFHACLSIQGAPLFKDHVLWLLSPLTTDPVLDIRVYASATYCTALERLLRSAAAASVGKHLVTGLDELARLYALEKAMIGSTDFTQHINTPILNILGLAAGRVKFSADMFQLLTIILRMDPEPTGAAAAGQHKEQVLEILQLQTVLAPAPSYVLDAVENLMAATSGQESPAALKILEISSRQYKTSLQVATLQLLVKVLMDPATAAAGEQHQLVTRTLFSCILNQDVPDSIFTTFDFHFVVSRFQSCAASAKSFSGPRCEFLIGPTSASHESGLLATIFTYLRHHGLKLSQTHIHVFQLYLEQGKHSKSNLQLVLECLTTASENGQVFPENLIQLVFRPHSKTTKTKKAISTAYLALSLSLVQNNQKLPPEFLDSICAQFCETELKKIFGEDEMQTKAFAIVTKCVQNGHNMRKLELVVAKLCEAWEHGNGNAVQRLDILSALASLVNSARDDQHGDLDGDQLKRVFTEALRETNAQLLETGLHGFIGLHNNKFIAGASLGATDVNLLTRIQRASGTSPGVKGAINDFLQARRRGMKPGLQATLNLTNLDNKSNAQLLADFPMILKLEGWNFLEEAPCQTRIQSILYEEPDVKVVRSMVAILSDCPDPSRLPVAVLEAVAFASLNHRRKEEKLGEQCAEILKEAHARGAVFSSKLISYLQAGGGCLQNFPEFCCTNNGGASRNTLGRQIMELLRTTSLSKDKLVALLKKGKFPQDKEESGDILGGEASEQVLDAFTIDREDWDAVNWTPFVYLLARSVLTGVDHELQPGRKAKLVHMLEHQILNPGAQHSLKGGASVRGKAGGTLKRMRKFVRSQVKKMFGESPKKETKTEPTSTPASGDQEPHCEQVQLKAFNQLLSSGEGAEWSRLEQPADTLSALASAFDQCSSLETQIVILQLASSIISTSGDTAVEWLVSALYNESAIVRLLALQALGAGGRGDGQEVADLVALMKESILKMRAAGASKSLRPVVAQMNDEFLLFCCSLTYVDFSAHQKIESAAAADKLVMLKKYMCCSNLISSLGFESPFDQLRIYEHFAVIYDKMDETVFLEDISCWISFRLGQLAKESRLQALECLTHLQSAELASILKRAPLNMDRLRSAVVESCLKQKMRLRATPKVVQLLSSKLTESEQNCSLSLAICRAIKEITHLHQVESIVDALQHLPEPGAQELLGFVSRMEPNSADISELVILLQTHALFQSLPEPLQRKPRIKRLIKALLTSGIKFEDISKIGALEHFPEYEYALSQAFQYQITPSVFAKLATTLCEEILPTTGILNKLTRSAGGIEPGLQRALINKLIAEGVFDGKDGVKDIHQIVNEFRQANSRTSFKWAALKERFVKAGYEWDILKLKVIQVLDGDKRSKINGLEGAGVICSWTEADILSWARATGAWRNQEQELTENEIYFEALLVARRAMKLHRNFDLTRVQVLACLVALQKLDKDRHKGQLQQVATGSGKSAIVAILAAIKALLGKRGGSGFVDVYTSSPILAERDAKEWSPFYAMFGLACDHNTDRGQYLYGPKPCYAARIVYGDCSQFQFDYLRDVYSNLGTLGGRTLDYAIVDEVDAMLLDDIAKLARLSAPLPGMDTIHLVYHLLWNRLLYMQAHLFAVKDFYFYVQGSIKSLPNGLVQYTFAHPKTQEAVSIPDLFQYIVEATTTDLADACIFGVDDIDAYESKGGQRSIVPVPKYLRGFVEGQVEAWVDSALTALMYEENVHYIVDEETIKPVDYLTTGVVQSNTNWNNGLHQFLGLKHSVKIQPETVTTNFLSNLAMFEKYGPNLVGFSGTLGSASGRAVLYNTYNVRVLRLPETHYKRYIQFPDVVVPNLEAWQREIVLSCVAEAGKGRGVLVICETIRAAHMLGSTLSSFGARVKLYVKNDEQELEERIERMHPGDIIVATNLAGRGTDIKTLNIEEHGGLHVCLTFLPQSQRIQEQAFGRTSRQGNKGTGQLIIVSEDADAELVKATRASAESDTLNAMLKEELPGIRTRGRLFDEFCSFVSSLRTRLREEAYEDLGYWDKTCAAVKSGVDYVSGGLTQLDTSQFTLPIKETLILQSVEERWAMFLRKVDREGLEGEKALAAYREFEDGIERQLKSGRGKVQIMVDGQNAFYFAQLGNFEFLQGNKICLDYFRTAIELDDQFSVGARIGLGTGLLKFAPEPQFKHRALDVFREAVANLYQEKGYINGVQTLTLQAGGGEDSSLMRQLTEKANLIGCFINTVETNIRTIEKALRRVHLTCSNKQKESRTEILPAVLSSEERGATLKPFSSHSGFCLSFHDLTAHKDMVWTKDQAAKTLPPSDAWFKTKIKCEVGLKCESPDLHKLLENEKHSSVLLDKVPIMSVQLREVLYDEETGKLRFNLFGGKFKFKTFDAEICGDSSDLKTLLKHICLETELVANGGSVQIELVSTTKENVQVTRSFLPSDVAAAAAAVADPLTSIKLTGLTTAVQLDKLGRIIVDSTTKHPANGGLPLSLTLHSIETAAGGVKERKAKVNALKEAWTELSTHFKSNTLHLHGMSVAQAEKVIPAIRASDITFVLEISGLDFESAVSVYQNARVEGEDFAQQKNQELTEMYMHHCIPLLEIHQLRDRGISILVCFNEKSPIPWCTLITICGIAAAQVALGGFLISTGFGASMGISLITEGFSDVQVAYRIYTTRQFSWSAYGTQKAVSLVISACSLGMSGLKDGAQGLKVLGSSGVKNAAGNSAAKALLTTSGKNLATLAIKKVAVKGMETGARMALKELTNRLTDWGFEQVRSIIQAEVSSRVRAGFGDPKFHRVVCQRYAMQKALSGKMEKPGESRFQGKVVGIVRGTTNPKAGTWTSLWDSVGSPLAVGILSDPQYVGSPIATLNQVLGALSGFKEIGTVTGRVLDKIRETLEQEPNSMRLIFKKAGVSSEFASNLALCQDSKRSAFDFKPAPVQGDFSSKEEFEAFKKVVEDLKGKEQSLAKEDNYDMSRLQMTVINILTDHIIKIANSHLVSPVMSRLGGQIVSQISQQLQDAFIVSEAENAPGSEGKQNLDQQIMGNARAHIKSYRMVELEILVDKVSEEGGTNGNGEHVPPAVIAKANQVKENAPIDATLLSLQVKKHNLPVKVVTDPTYKPTPEEQAAGVRIVIYTPGEGPGDVGHFQLKTPDGEGFVDVTGRSTNPNRDDKNDCGFQILAELLDTTAEEVRLDSAKQMLEHPTEFNRINEINSDLRERFPLEANQFLMVGGARRQPPPPIPIPDDLQNDLRPLMRRSESGPLTREDEQLIKSLVAESVGFLEGPTPTEQSDKGAQGFVYILRAKQDTVENRYKIGKAEVTEFRKQQLERGNDEEYELIAAIPATYRHSTETFVHRILDNLDPGIRQPREEGIDGHTEYFVGDPAVFESLVTQARDCVEHPDRYGPNARPYTNEELYNLGSKFEEGGEPTPYDYVPHIVPEGFPPGPEEDQP